MSVINSARNTTDVDNEAYQRFKTSIQEAYQRCENDVEKAKHLIEQQVALDSALRSYLLGIAIDIEVRAIVREEKRRLRPVSECEPYVDHDLTPSCIPGPLNGLARMAVATLYEYPLHSGKKLGNATKADLHENAQRMFKQSREAADRGRWLSLIADRVPIGKKVRKVLSEQELRQLLEHAKNGP